MESADNQPITTQDLNQALDCAVEAIAAAVQAASAEQRAAIEAAEARTQEFARDIETKLLNAFHIYALGQTARLSTAETAAYNMGVRMAALEDRVLSLETRQRPPQ
jgi:hypothetical protein